MSTDDIENIPFGTAFQVTPDFLARKREQFSKAIEYARKSQTHLWIVTTSYQISDTLAGQMARGMNADPQLDRESIADVGVGCYMCEEPLAARLLNRRCKEVHAHD